MNATEFFAAIGADDRDGVAAALAAHPSLANATLAPDDAGGVTGYSALHAAARANRVEIARSLIDAGADLEARAGSERESRTPLHDSFEFGGEDVTELLLERGAFFDVCTAAALGRVERLRELLDDDPALANDRSSGLSPLGWASYGNALGSIDLLVERGAELGAAICCACQCGHEEAVDGLLAHGADPNVRLSDGYTPLHDAAEMRYTCDAVGVVERLLAAGADPNARDGRGLTPLELLLRASAAEGLSPAKVAGYEAIRARLEAAS